MKAIAVLSTIIVVLSIAFYGVYEEYTSLQRKYFDLYSSYTQLYSNYVSMEYSYTQILNSMANLSREYRAVSSSYRSLYVSWTSITRAYSVLSFSYSVLSQRYEELEHEYTVLRRSYELLEEKYLTLETDYTKLIELVQRLRKLMYLYTYDEIALFLDKFVEIGREIVDELNLSFLGEKDPVVKVKYMLYITAYYLDYNYEEPYYSIDTVLMTIREEQQWLPPNYTLERGGDCEDLSLFIYSVLKNLASRDAELYLIAWYTETEGHMALLYIASNKEAFLIDPVLSWYNDLYLLLKLYVYNGSSPTQEKYYYSVLPMSINSYFRRYLIKYGFAELEWYDPIEKKWNPDYYYSFKADKNGLTKLINDWLKQWNVKPVKLRIVGTYGSYLFNSVEELVEYLT